MTLVVKNLSASAGNIRDMGSILGSGTYPGVGHGKPSSTFAWTMPIDSGSWWPTVHYVAKESHMASVQFSVQFSSVAQSCPTLCNPMDCSTPGIPVHYQLPEFTQTHVH